MNSKKFAPFLFNLVSGRRRLLTNHELALVLSMHKNNNCYSSFNESEVALFNKLHKEKQFFTDEDMKKAVQDLIDIGHFKPTYKSFLDDFRFIIELTKACNLRCSYCYMHSRLNNSIYITKEYIDAIHNFFLCHTDEATLLNAPSNIFITGGEPLMDSKTIDMLNYIALKWPKAKMTILTNGINLLKYYHELSLGSIKRFDISLDGTKDLYMDRFYAGHNSDEKIYDDIIKGIKKLLQDEVEITIKTVLDKSNYEK